MRTCVRACVRCVCVCMEGRGGVDNCGERGDEVWGGGGEMRGDWGRVDEGKGGGNEGRRGRYVDGTVMRVEGGGGMRGGMR